MALQLTFFGCRLARWARWARSGLGLAVALAGAAPVATWADSGHPAAGRIGQRAAGAVRAMAAGDVGASVSAAAGDEARVIVKYRAGAALLQGAQRSPQRAAQLGQRLALSLADGRVLGERMQALRGTGLSSGQLAARLAAQSDVEWAVVDQRRFAAATVPNDPYFGSGLTVTTPEVGQWFLRAPGGESVAATNALGAWGLTTGAPSVVVAVLDTGVRLTHPDLVGKLLPGYDFISRTGTSLDGDGRDADASDPGDWSQASDSCGASDSSWHGTQVAGLIAAATDNGIGVAGLARNVSVLPVRVLGRCGGFDSDIIAGMRWAGGLSSDPVANANPARVINMSLGSSGTCNTAYRDVIAELAAASVAVVVAAGNDTGHAVNTPANCTGAIAVAGLRHAGTKVGYSNIGPQVAVAAPAGNCILVRSGWPCLYPLMTTTNTGTTLPAVDTYSSGTNPSLGTSFATPLVAGAAALMLSANPALSPAQLKAMLQATARPFPTVGGADASVQACQAPTTADQLECYCTTSTCGAGMLDVAAAVAGAAATRVAPAAAIALSSRQPAAGTAVTLDGLSSGASARSFTWVKVAGAGNFVGSTSAASLQFVPAGSPPWTVALTVADETGASSTAQRSFGTPGPSVSIVAPGSAPVIGQALQVSGSASPASGRRIVGYDWQITQGGDLATLQGATNGTAVTLVPSAAGTVVLGFSVADNEGDAVTAELTVQVPAASGSTGGSGSSGGTGSSSGSGTSTSSSTGGGALGLGWVVGLAWAVAAIGRRPRRG